MPIDQILFPQKPWKNENLDPPWFFRRTRHFLSLDYSFKSPVKDWLQKVLTIHII
jgi:hypothetical protein